jgi:hypothetical protein
MVPQQGSLRKNSAWHEHIFEAMLRTEIDEQVDMIRFSATQGDALKNRLPLEGVYRFFRHATPLHIEGPRHVAHDGSTSEVRVINQQNPFAVPLIVYGLSNGRRSRSEFQ